MLARVATGQRQSSLGLAFQAPIGLLTGAFGESGVVITEVIEGGPADLAVFRVPGGTGAGRSGSDQIRALAESTADDPEPEALLTVRGGEVLHARSGVWPASA